MDLMLLRRRLIPVEEGEPTDLFVYSIINNIAVVTAVKSSLWYERFGNYNIVVPKTIEGCPVVIKA